MQLFKSIRKLFQPQICRLEKVPKYVLFEIIKYLSYIDLQKITQLNKYFNKRMKDVELWQILLNKKLDRGYDNPRKLYLTKKTRHLHISGNVGTPMKFYTNLVEILPRIVKITKDYRGIIDWDDRLYIYKHPHEGITFLLNNVKTISCQKKYMAILTNTNSLYIWGYNLALDRKIHHEAVFVVDNIQKIYTHSCLLYVWDFDGRMWETDYDTINQWGKFKGTYIWPSSLKAKQILRPEDYYWLYVDDENKLYFHHYIDRGRHFIADNVDRAYVNDKFIYWTNTKHKLYRIKCDFSQHSDYKLPKKIANGVQKIAFTKDYLHILSTDFYLYQISLSTMILQDRTIPNVLNVNCCYQYGIATVVD